MERAAASYLAELLGFPVVRVFLEGRSVLLGFDPDPYEHPRRVQRGLGAVRSRRLLQALWSLPHEMPWATTGLDPVDLRTLGEAGGGHVEFTDSVIRRTYQPPGLVRSVGLWRKELANAVCGVGQFPAIFSRHALATREGARCEEALATAAALGIGAAVSARDGLKVHTNAHPPQQGVPGVYRWWIAEMAYHEWRQTTVH